MELIDKVYNPHFREEDYLINPISDQENQLIKLDSGKNFCLGKFELALLKLCNGKSSIQEIIRENKLNLTENDFCRFILQALKIGLLETNEEKMKQPLNILALKLPLIRLSKAFICRKRVAQVMKYILYLMCLIAFVYIGYVVKTDFQAVVSIITTTNYIHLHNIIFYFLTFFILAFVHENAHAIVLASYGVLPGRMGIMLSYFHPSCYIEVTGVNKIKSKFSRIQVWLAGIVSQICLFALCLYIILNFKLNATMFDFMLIACIVNFSLMFFNLFYVIKLDGYHILCDLLDDNFLREEAIQFILNHFEPLKNQKQSTFVYTIVGVVCLAYIPAFVVGIITNIIRFYVDNAGHYIDIGMIVVMSITMLILCARLIITKVRRRVSA